MLFRGNTTCFIKISVFLLIKKVLLYIQHIASQVFSYVTKNQNEWCVFANYAWIYSIQTELKREVRLKLVDFRFSWQKKNRACIVLLYYTTHRSRPLHTCWTNILLLSSGSFYPDDDSSRFLKVLVTT